MKLPSTKLLSSAEQWPFVALVVVAIFSIALLQWNHQRWQATLQEQTTALDYMVQARLYTNRSYLIAEQVANGDQTALPQDALAYADRAIFAVDDWLGGRSALAHLADATPPSGDLRALLLQYRQQLVEFRALEAQTLQNATLPTAADAVDWRIAFSSLERQADLLEQALRQRLASASVAQQRQHAMAFGLWSAFLFVLGVTVLHSMRAQRVANAALQANEERFRAQYKGIPIATYTWQRVDNDFVLQTYNHAAEVMTKGAIAHLVGVRATEFFATQPAILEDFERCITEHTTFQRELRYHMQMIDEVKDMLVSYVFVPPDLVMIHTEDRTERNQLESQLMRAQRMESIGRLAGGIAHDFNNLLTAISGFATLAAESLPADEPVQDDLAQIRQSTKRAARLTAQLLAFARRQHLQPSNLNINDLIRDMEPLARRVLPEHVRLSLLLAPTIGIVHADVGQLEQVMLNLVLNARDAMLDGGQLTIETAHAELDEAYARQHVEVTPGQYIMFAVHDTGMGMNPMVQSRAFDPFFTTKGPQGSGLGLAMCYGIVKQHGGHIVLSSEVGQGTSVKVYLPQVEAEVVPQPESPDAAALHGTETVLVVEDEGQVREVVVRTLRQQGYTVLESANGLDGLDMAKLRGPGTIQLVITDIVMPDMNGHDLVKRLHTWDSSVKALFISGYSEHAAVTQQCTHDTIPVITKPFSSEVLARSVRAILDGEAH